MQIGIDTIAWAKVRPSAIIPTKREEDGWYDLYANFENDELWFSPHETKLVPTGIASAFSSKWKVSLGERGSNTKSNLQVMAGKIDSGYRGEYFVALHNANDKDLVVSKHDCSIYTDGVVYAPYSKAICQLEITEVPVLEHIELGYEELLLIESERGTGMLGSSGK